MTATFWVGAEVSPAVWTARPALLPCTLFTHQNAANGIVAGGCAGLAERVCVQYVEFKRVTC